MLAASSCNSNEGLIGFLKKNKESCTITSFQNNAINESCLFLPGSIFEQNENSVHASSLNFKVKESKERVSISVNLPKNYATVKANVLVDPFKISNNGSATTACLEIIVSDVGLWSTMEGFFNLSVSKLFIIIIDIL